MQVNSIVQAVLFFCLMVYAAYKDISKREIPPFIWISVSLISLIDFNPVHLSGILAALPLLIIAVWIAPNRLGGGDIKFAGAAGLVLGLQETNLGMIIGLTLQVCVFITYALYKKIKKEEAKNLSMPLAPCLSIGFLAIYFMKLGGIIHEFV
jgi:leader peptidase (prepilin peptidase) / N-methyltransferase